MDPKHLIYLDHNATTDIRPEAVEAIVAALEATGNPSSVHLYGRETRRILEDARDQIAALAGANPSGVIFTSGGTEANNLALRGTDRKRILVSAGEHAAVLEATQGAEVIPIDDQGIVDLSALQEMMAKDDRPAIISVMVANNETGIIQPIEKIAEVAKQFGALLHCDAVQAGGKIPLDMVGMGIDMMVLSGHKIGGPAGVGALIIKGDIHIHAINRGGGQERRRRGGTENLSGIAGFGAAAVIARSELDNFMKLAVWRDKLERETGAFVFGKDAQRLANTSFLAMPGVSAATQVMAFDLAGFAVSAGSACSSGKVEPSHVLAAMGADKGFSDAAIRVSLGWNSRPSDIDDFISAWIALNQRSSLDRKVG